MESLKHPEIRRIIHFYVEAGLIQLSPHEENSLVDTLFNRNITYINSLFQFFKNSYFYFHEEDYFLKFNEYHGFNNIYEKLVFDLGLYSKGFFYPKKDSIKIESSIEFTESILLFTQDDTLYKDNVFRDAGNHIYSIVNLVNLALKRRFSNNPLFHIIPFDDGGMGFILMTENQYSFALDERYLLNF